MDTSGEVSRCRVDMKPHQPMDTLITPITGHTLREGGVLLHAANRLRKSRCVCNVRRIFLDPELRGSAAENAGLHYPVTDRTHRKIIRVENAASHCFASNSKCLSSREKH